MSQESNNSPIAIIAVIILAVIAIISNNADKISSDIDKIYSDISNILNWIILWRFYLLALVILLPTAVYIAYLILSGAMRKKLEERRAEKERIESETREIEEIIDKSINSLNLREAKELEEQIIKKLRTAIYSERLMHYKSQLKEKLRELRHLLVELGHKDKLREISRRKEILEAEIDELEREKQERISNEEQENEKALEQLEIDDINVFIKKDLTDREISVLFEERYSQTNQYGIDGKGLLTVLVKPILNHSATHTFLVWDVARMLKKIEGISDIEIHLTKDADITFKYGGMMFAIEIETGTLLDKPAQRNKKIAFLNRKYGNRWMFVVSNKDLIWQYRKLGFSTQRIEVEKNIRKMLRDNTQL